MKRVIGLSILMFAVITATLAVFLSQTSNSSETYAQSAYPPPGSSAPYLPPSPYPAPWNDTKPTPVPTEKVVSVKVSMDVTIEGLEGIDTVELQMIPDTNKTASSLQTLGVTLPKASFHNESGMITATVIPIGTYKLMVFAPDSYFREPQGFLFQVTETGIVNYAGTTFHFKLIPPSAQDLPPCRDTLTMANPLLPEPAGDVPFEEQKIICKAERLIDVSSPPKQPERPTQSKSNSVLGAGYHYAGPHTFQDNQGVWGRNYVVNPSNIQGGGNRFIAERVYAANGATWIEAGWAEVSWRDDRQYIYKMDGTTQTWNFYDQYSLQPDQPWKLRSITTRQSTNGKLCIVSEGVTGRCWPRNRSVSQRRMTDTTEARHTQPMASIRIYLPQALIWDIC